MLDIGFRTRKDSTYKKDYVVIPYKLDIGSIQEKATLGNRTRKDYVGYKIHKKDYLDIVGCIPYKKRLIRFRFKEKATLDIGFRTRKGYVGYRIPYKKRLRWV
ncbi:hypothetical protein CEXT_308601 [Caerostris extrusa]|uniref:Uncharacterized protein n=1 Tax=Caerostris extrusa TaxID=172846 RepID=A0AAV4XNZ8_CAEEX|nr:hypothetical protein CEXT_308601 [Caerostris extrusa]